ncbi:hypothetical protein D3C81_990850 [compost metagenome]
MDLLPAHSRADTLRLTQCHPKPQARALESQCPAAARLAKRPSGGPQGRKGTAQSDNCIDNKSAKMATGTGVIQIYTGVAVVDEKAQIIVEAQAQAQAQAQGAGSAR